LFEIIQIFFRYPLYLTNELANKQQMERRKRFETRGRNFILDRFKTMCYLSVEQFPGNSNLNGKNLISIVLKGQTLFGCMGQSGLKV